VSVYTDASQAFKEGDLDLRIDGKATEVIAVERSARPLSVVFLFITNTANCFGRDVLFSDFESINRVFRADDNLAIVVSDRSGTVVREFASPQHSLASDLSKAVEIVNRNSSQELKPEYATYDTKQGLVFPMRGLLSSIKLLEQASPTDDKAIVIINDLENTRSGTREEASRALSTLLENRISVSWLALRSFESRFSIKKIPYGRRGFFFTLPDASGGIVRECREVKDSRQVVWGRDRTKYSSFEDDLFEILEPHRNRFRLKFRNDSRMGNSIRSVSVSWKNPAHLNSTLIYPRAIKARE